VEIPKTRYARSADGTFIAYQVFGDGPVDLLWISPWFSDLEMLWEYEPVARFHREIAGFARLILMDQRGVGLSDRSRGFPDLETRMDDLRAVLDAAGSGQTVLWGAGPDGGALYAMFAATYPDRVSVLAFWNARAKSLSSGDYVWGDDLAAQDAFRQSIEAGWGLEEHTAEIMRQMGAPSVAVDPAGVHWAARVCRRMGAPGDVLAFDSMWRRIDFRAVLPAVHVPTVAVYRAFPGGTGGNWSVRGPGWPDPRCQGGRASPGRVPTVGAQHAVGRGRRSGVRCRKGGGAGGVRTGPRHGRLHRHRGLDGGGCQAR